ncbi:MAG: hypothetical protein HYX69_06600 [Planctomycetia bacterium]|nr:hypothetical protein [Planctomycetia bacterium]
MRYTTRFFSRTASLFVLAAGCALSARGDFLLPTAWQRTDPGSTYQEWNVFASADGSTPNAPDVGLFNPASPANGNPDVFDTSGGSFLTGGGNIYSFSVATDIDAVIPNYGYGSWYHTTLILQTRTIGSEIDYAGVHIGTAAPAAQQELGRVPVGSPGGDTFQVDHLFRFELAGNAASYLAEFMASAPSMSLDRVAVDTFASLTGDANRDHSVDVSDIQTIAAGWLTAGPAGDVNFSGLVDISDVQTVAANWLHTQGGAGLGIGGFAAVPEPASIVLAFMGCAAVVAVGIVRGRSRKRCEGRHTVLELRRRREGAV